MDAGEKQSRHGDTIKKLRRNKTISRLIHAGTILGLLLAIGFAVYGFSAGIFTSEESLEQFISDSGVTAPLVFIPVSYTHLTLPTIA